MKLVERLLTNHPLVNILFVVVLVMGAVAYFTMPREQDPEINFNWVNIRTILPGASAEDVEKLVTSPLEDALRGVQDIKFVSSNTRESSSMILVRFRDLPVRVFDKRMADLRREIQNKANEELPDEAEDPFILEITSSNGFPTALVVVTGPADNEVLRRQARLVKEDIERLTGVDRVQAFGLQDPELHVRFDPQALANRGMNATQLADTLRSAFRDTSAGEAQVGEDQWLVRVIGTTVDPDILADFQIAGPYGTSFALRDVAEVSRSREEPETLVSINGDPAISLSVSKVGFTNTIQLVERINDYIAQRNEAIAGTGVSLLLADDQTIPTQEAVGVMQRNAAVGLLLVLFVCWLFLGLRIATLVTMGIGFSIAGAFWILQMTGNTLNISVLLGVVIVLGMLVDDAVVVVDAIYYRIQRGASALQASLDALREVVAPVTSAIMTTIAAFLPLMLLPGIVGKFMFVIPFVVTIGLLVSLIEAFWILPSHVIGAGGSSIAKGYQQQDWRARWTHWVRIRYTRILCAVLRRPLVMLSVAALCLALAIGAVASNLIRINFFTFDPLRIFYVYVDMPSDASLETTLNRTQTIATEVKKLMRENEARAVTSMAGVKFTETEFLFGDQYGQVQVSLNPRGDDPRDIADIVESLRPVLTQLPGAGEISFLILTGGPPTTKPINVKVRSDDFTELRAATDAVKRIASNIEGAIDVIDNDVPGRYELALKLDTTAVRQAGLEPGQVSRLLRLHLDGEVIAFTRDEGEKVELRVLGEDQTVSNIQDVLDAPVVAANGQITTFGGLTNADISQGRGTIRHHNLRRSISVEGELDDEIINSKEANNLIVSEWEKIRSQYPNTDLEFSGELDDINESLDAMVVLFLFGLGLIYLILATQFRSYFQPFLILVTVPLAFTGVAFGLLLTGNPLSLYTLYGVIALTGIAVNSAIVLIDAANERIAKGMRPLHATVYAARRRVIPILMTTSTTIAGLFSLALGLGGKSLLWGPVASSIVAGLLFASALTLFVVPTLYRFFMRGHGLPDADQQPPKSIARDSESSYENPLPG